MAGKILRLYCLPDANYGLEVMSGLFWHPEENVSKLGGAECNLASIDLVRLIIGGRFHRFLCGLRLDLSFPNYQPKIGNVADKLEVRSIQ